MESIADENRKLVLKTPVDESYEEEAGEMVIIIEKVRGLLNVITLIKNDFFLSPSRYLVPL